MTSVLLRRTQRPAWASPAWLLVPLAAYVLAVTVLLNGSYNLAGAVLVVHGVGIVSAAILVRALRDEDERMRRIIVVALLLKLAFSMVRYYVIFNVYGGSADAPGYHNAGEALAEQFRSRDFSLNIGNDSLIGTRFLELLTGGVYTITGPTMIGGFFVFSWMGFWGSYLFYRAFRVALPDAETRRYGLLVFLLPSMLFWPSSIGKEAWMELGLGLCALGVASFLRAPPRGAVLLALGTVATSLVRPHITLAVWVSFCAAWLMARRPNRSESALNLTRVAGSVVLVLGVSAVLAQTQGYFEVKTETTDPTAIAAQAAETTTQGGSEFEATPARSPAQVPFAIISVLFRPFPFETGNPLALVASAEGTGLLIAIVVGRRRIIAALQRARMQPYVLFAVIYTVIFCIAFSYVGNFGILARQRVQVFPLLIVVLCVPLSREARARWRSKKSDAGQMPAPSWSDAPSGHPASR